jgi:hypothetical protein
MHLWMPGGIWNFTSTLPRSESGKNQKGGGMLKSSWLKVGHYILRYGIAGAERRINTELTVARIEYRILLRKYNEASNKLGRLERGK